MITELGPCSKAQISKKVVQIARESDALTDEFIFAFRDIGWRFVDLKDDGLVTKATHKERSHLVVGLSLTELITYSNTMNRSELQDNMIQQILDDMDIKTMMAILYDNMSEKHDKYSDKELMAEVEEYYPHLLEDSEEPSEATGWQ